MKKLFGFVLISLFVAAMTVTPAMADIFVKQASHTDAFELGGQKMAAHDDTVTIWLSDSRIRMDQGDTASIITDMDTEMMYYLDHTKKKMAEFKFSDLGDFKKMLGLDDADPQQKQQIQMMEQMMAMQKISATVTPTEETKEIDGYKCKKYNQVINIGMMKMTMDIWATNDVDYNKAMVDKMQNFYMSIMPGFNEAAEEMKKIDGLVVQNDGVLSAMGTSVNITSHLVEYKNADAPAGTYDLPTDYTKTKGLSLPGM